MRTWVIKPEMRSNQWPDDLLCIEIPGEYPEDFQLLWIKHDGTWDLELCSPNGTVNPAMFDMFESEP